MLMTENIGTPIASVLLLLIVMGCDRRLDDGGTLGRAGASQQATEAEPTEADSRTTDGLASGNSTSGASAETVGSTPGDGGSPLQAAQEAAAANDLDTATRRVREHLLMHPGDPPGLFLAAQLQAARGNYFEAAKVLDDVPLSHPQAGLAALGQSADWMLAAERWAEAEERYEKLLERVPSANLAHRRLASLLNRQGRRQEAAMHVRFLCRAGDVTQAELHTLINVCEAIFDEQLTTTEPTPNQTPIGATARARILYSKNQFREALDVLREPFDGGELPASGRAFFGRLAMEVEDDAAIRDWLKRRDREQEAFGDYWFALGTRLLGEGEDPTGAARLFCEAVLRKPTDWVAVTRLENCLDLTGDSDGVKTCRARAMTLRKSIRLHGKLVDQEQPDPTLISELAKTLDQLGRPIEAVMWRAIAVIAQGGDRAALEQLNRTRQELVKTTSVGIEANEALAGLSASRFPMPEQWIVSLSSSGTKKTRQLLPKHAATVVPRLSDVAQQVGINFQYFNAAEPKFADTQLYEQFGGGAAALDYDMDGRVDVFFNQSGADPKSSTRGKPDCLFRAGDAAFMRVHDALPKEEGYGQGVTAGDWNQDGFPDLVVANFGVNAVLINNGDGTFQSVKPTDLGADWSDAHWTSSLALGDIDGDHLPDLYEVNYVDDPLVHQVSPRGPNGRFLQSRGPESYRAAHDRVFLQRSQGELKVVHLDRGSTSTQTHGLGLVLTDIDGQPGNEIFVANDTDANQLWVRTNSQKDTAMQLTDVAGLRGCAHSRRGGSGASMGIATADFDGNGMIDFHVTNFLNEPVHFYLQDADNSFRDSVIKARLYRESIPVLGFGTQAADFDSNGTIDLAVVNGHIDDLRYKGAAHRMRPQLFLGVGGRFETVKPNESVGGYWGQPTVGRGLLKLDWNRDGRIDLLSTHHDVPAALLENQTPSDYNWLQLTLVGTMCERDAIGAIATVRIAGRQMMDVVTSGDGYACKNEAMLAFGLGQFDRVKQVTIRWPTGESETFEVPAVNRRYLLVQGSGEAWH